MTCLRTLHHRQADAVERKVASRYPREWRTCRSITHVYHHVDLEPSVSSPILVFRQSSWKDWRGRFSFRAVINAVSVSSPNTSQVNFVNSFEILLEICLSSTNLSGSRRCRSICAYQHGVVRRFSHTAPRGKLSARAARLERGEVCVMFTGNPYTKHAMNLYIPWVLTRRINIRIQLGLLTVP